MKLQGGCLVLLLFAFYFVTADKSMNYTGVYVNVLEQSGKIVVGNTSNFDADPNSVKLQFSEIKEKDSNGSEVGKNGVRSHTFNTFAIQNFSFSSTVNVSYQNITAIMFNFNASLVNATLMTSVYIFKEDGNITDANETTNIKAGNVKFIINIINWKFCGSSDVICNGSASEVGKYLDFSIVISGNRSASNATKGTSDGDMYNLGGAAGIILSKKVRYDDHNWTNMTVGYPKMTTTGENQTFTFRFEKFNSSALYSLTVAVGGFDGQNGNSIGGNGTTVGGNDTTVGGNGTTVSANGTTVRTTVGANSGNTLSLSFLLAFLAISLFYFLFYMT